MELSSIKLFLYFRKVFLIFWETEPPKKLLMFQEIELSDLEKLKKTLKKCIIFPEMELSSPKLKKGRKEGTYFRKNLQSLQIKNSRFLFGERELFKYKRKMKELFTLFKDIRNLFRLKIELNYTAIKDIRNLYRQDKETKAIKDRILRDIKNLFEHEEEEE